MSKNDITVRFAPSPTGYLHIGGARTMLFNYLFAKQNNGKLILRIDDTDKERSTKEYENSILESLKWLGLEYDEIYKQSERIEIYKKYLNKLIEEDKAYVSKETPKKEGDRKEVIRFRNPNKKVKFTDLILGEIEADTSELGDFVIAKSIDEPIYHFTSVVDDYEMKITHVIRGQDHISNTQRQILIQEAIEAKAPIYAHISLILNSDKSKLSKRDSAVNVVDYKKDGYLPEAVINFLAFLGWNPGDEREIMSIEELIKNFDISKVQKGGAVFNIEKLNWINKKYITNIPDSMFEEKINEFVSEKLKNKLQKLVSMIKERINKFSDVKKMEEDGEFDYYFNLPTYGIDKLVWKEETKENTAKYLNKIIKLISGLSDNEFKTESIKEKVWDYASEKGRGSVLWPMRYSLSGVDKSPDPFILAEILGKKETISRLENAINRL